MEHVCLFDHIVMLTTRSMPLTPTVVPRFLLPTTPLQQRSPSLWLGGGRVAVPWPGMFAAEWLPVQHTVYRVEKGQAASSGSRQGK